MVLELKIDTKDVLRVVNVLKEEGNRRSIETRIRWGLNEVRPEAESVLREQARALPSKGPKHTGLRERIAKAIHAEIVDVPLEGPKLAIGIQRTMMGTQVALPKKIDIGSWRHPVYGNRKVWRTQIGKKGWYTDTVKTRIHPKVAKAMEEAAAKILASLAKKR